MFVPHCLKTYSKNLRVEIILLLSTVDHSLRISTSKLNDNVMLHNLTRAGLTTSQIRHFAYGLKGEMAYDRYKVKMLRKDPAKVRLNIYPALL